MGGVTTVSTDQPTKWTVADEDFVSAKNIECLKIVYTNTLLVRKQCKRKLRAGGKPQHPSEDVRVPTLRVCMDRDELLLRMCVCDRSNVTESGHDWYQNGACDGVDLVVLVRCS